MRTLVAIAGILCALLSTPVKAESAMREFADVIEETGPTFEDKATETGEQTELRSMIGQMIIVGFEGASVGDPSFQTLLEKVRSGRVSGVLYLQRNMSSRNSIVLMNEALQKAASVPLIVAVDQEGGAIQRIPRQLGFPRVPAARDVSERLSPRQAYEAYSALARTLRKWGFNLNLGPVVDLNINPKNPIIGRLGRSFSEKPDEVVQYSAAFVDAHRRHGVLTALKHFPGHGSATADSHTGFVDVKAKSDAAELKVFEDLVHDDFADLVMVGHTYDANLQTGQKLPASLDAAIVSRLLRGKIGFEGAVITDDLQMAAVSETFSLKETVLKAVLAGNDLLVFANAKTVDPNLDQKIADILTDEATANPEIRHAIDRAAERIAQLKRKLGDGLDGVSTRSVVVDGTYVTPEFIIAQKRPVFLVPIF